MHLYDVPLVFVLAGLCLYVVLGGADFGAGFWELVAGRGPGAEEIREESGHAIGPVWEANHVWLIFVLTVLWTAYPLAFGSIAATLAVPLFLAGIGIVLRGGAYVLRAGTPDTVARPVVDALFSVSSILTPFALGTVVGALAAGRVSVGNPGGTMFSSWLNPVSITVGVLAVVSGAYEAAVFLSGDASRRGKPELAERFRVRALGAGVAAGAIGVVGLVVLEVDAHRLFRRLTDGPGLPALVVSIAAGVVTLALVYRRRYEPARLTAGLAVAAMIAGWALAENPLMLRDLTVRQAAAPHDTLIAVIVAVVAGGVILFPSLALLFGLTLRGSLEPGPVAAASPVAPGPTRTEPRFGLPARLAVAFLLAALGLLSVAQAGWAHAVGVVCLFGFAVAAFAAVLPPPETAAASVDDGQD